MGYKTKLSFIKTMYKLFDSEYFLIREGAPVCHKNYWSLRFMRCTDLKFGINYGGNEGVLLFCVPSATRF